MINKDFKIVRPDPPGAAEELAKTCQKEQNAINREREVQLDRSLAPFRVGSTPFLNTVPLTRGLEEEIVFAPPSKLGEMLERNELDAALVSVTVPLLNDGYDILDGIAVASLGEVKSVFLAHRKPFTQMRELYCDPASLASVQMVRVLLAEQNVFPEFKPLPSYETDAMPDFALLIGDPALRFLHGPHEHEIWDLGTAWYELTKLPFVHAVWTLRRGLDTKALRHQLREARDFGMDTLDAIIQSRTEYTLDFRKDYLGWHIQYHLGSDEKRGIQKLIELMRKHGIVPVYEPRYVF